METNRNENNRPEEGEVLENTKAEAGVEKARDGSGDFKQPETGGPRIGTEKDEAEELPEKDRAEPAPLPQEPRKKNTLGKALRSSKFKRGGMATLMSVVFIAIVVVINILVGLLTDRFPSMNMDLTAQKLNSLSDQAMEIAKGVEQDTTIYLIGTEDKYRKNQIYSGYGLEYSQVANLAEKLQEANSKISVEFVDPDANPKFISDYSSENLTTGTVLVKTEKRYRVLSVSDMFSLQTNQNTYQRETYSKVDGALASALEAVNLDKVPVITMATGHGEILDSEYLGSFTDLMEKQNFEIKEIDFLTDEIPEDTQVLMLPTPTTDYTAEEIDKLHAYLNDETRGEEVTLLVTCHATQGSLPRLAGFLEEWGIKVEEGAVVESDASRMAAANPSYMLVDPNEKVVLSDNTYRNLVAAASSPITLLFSGNGDVSTEALWLTSDNAYTITEDMTEVPEDPETSQKTVAAISAKYVQIDGDNLRRNVIVFGSSLVFTDSFINASAYGDGDYLRDLLQYCTGTDGSAVSVYVEQVQTDTRDVSASVSTVNLLGLGVFTIGLPLVILIAGLVIFLKRRHL